MRWYWAGAILLATASCTLCWWAWRAWWASGHPWSVTVYKVAIMVEPAISPYEAVLVVVAEHLMVGAGLYCLVRGARRGA